MRKVFRILILAFFLSCNNDKKNADKSDQDSTEPPHKISSLIDTSTTPTSGLKLIENSTIVDSAKIQELSKQVNFKKDEFKTVGWILPKNKPRFRSTNAIYCYFMKDSSLVSNFRFVIQYYADDWLFIEKYRFVIDDKPYSYIPTKVDTDNGYGGYIWEWCDDHIGNADEDLIKALANAKTAKIRFEGSKYYDEKIITKNQLQNIRIVYVLYKAMGGKFL